MNRRQEHSIESVLRHRSLISKARERSDVAAYRAVRECGVPVAVLADALGLTRQRVYQMVRHGEEILTSNT